ncbi:Trehalose-6-phosphate phosphatase [Fundidesulfovibrio magnetotacticus]|uniref:Trehalose 6-phosphate phosphatase n=1 Tax=Fundidesulfovibrio magnetotacticus TaxID=2730080 RepID=A0A6V8LPU4_9BACT|nr:trehalose-phosphatase [Fundidesulfovibrio magnetotacticus]GFK92571.1 Trehalose-6-phosphate phosphatase [Fundidesulfovibrio magnetotacticus]
MSVQLPGLRHLLEAPEMVEALSGRRTWILALDYDGTLAPFRPARDHAQPYAGVRDVLERLPPAGPSRMVLVSGREAGELARLLGIHPTPEIWGCHGAQRALPGMEPRLELLDAAQTLALERAEALIGDPALAERKPCGLAVHWRGLSPVERDALEARLKSPLRGLADEAGFQLHAFDGGLELRLPGVDKGTAVKALLQENPGALVLYLGDDKTDEDAFRALEGRGIGVLVNERPRPSRAAYRIGAPQELLILLGRFAASLGMQRRMLGGTVNT